MDAKEVEYLIIGAGPGGLQLAHEFEKLGLDYLILERANAPGSFFETYPRHGTLISINKVYSDAVEADTKLRFDWNSLLNDDGLLFTKYSKEFFPPSEALVRYLGDFARHYDLKIQYGTNVVRISHGEGDGYVVRTEGGETFACKRLIVATGRALPRQPDFPGAELCESYNTISLDPEEYAGQRVMIVGKGNSAFETADSMMNTTASVHMCSPTPIRLAWKTHYVGHLRAVNNGLLDTYQLKSGNTILDAHIQEVRRNEDGGLIARVRYVHAENQEREIPVDRVILCTGFAFDESPFDDDARPQMVPSGKFPDVTPAWESTNQKNMFFAGALMHGLDFEKTFSGFIHGFRYNVRVLAQLFATRDHDMPWPSHGVTLQPEAFADAILSRVNVSSSLYQQPGFIGDVIGVDPATGDGTWYTDVPIELVTAEGWQGYREYWTLVLDYGHQDFSDPFNIQRFPYSKGGEDSTFLHPILRRYVDGELVAEHQVSQDLENDWRGDRFRVPLLRFLNEQLLPEQARIA